MMEQNILCNYINFLLFDLLDLGYVIKLHQKVCNDSYILPKRIGII